MHNVHATNKYKETNKQTNKVKPQLSIIYILIIISLNSQYTNNIIDKSIHTLAMDSSSLKSFLISFRASANSFLSQYEPLALLLAPLLAFFVACTLHSFLTLLHQRGLKATLVGFFMTLIKYVFYFSFTSKIIWIY